MRGEPGEEPAQHAALGVVNRLLDGSGGPGRNPRRIADHERRPSFGDKIGLHDFHAPSQIEPRDVLAGAHQRTGILIRGNDARDPAARQHCRQYAGPGADVEG